MVKRLSVILREWWSRSWKRKIYDIFLYGFALVGVAIIGAWAGYQLGLTNNRGAIDKNYRYLMSVDEMKQAKKKPQTIREVNERWTEQYVKLIAFGHYYPTNAMLITQAAQYSNDPMLVDKMIAAAEVHIQDNEQYHTLAESLTSQLKRYKKEEHGLVVPWMRTPEWEALKPALVHDKALIDEAGRLTGVEPRLIVACLVGEQIRLFNTQRETVKKYLGPMKVLSVQSQFSYGVNGIKESTAKWVEDNLKDSTSEFYMGPDYEHLLDYNDTIDQSTERYNRLVDYRNHLYSYLYTGCILHQTMLQWKRAGYDISNRPDILFTLFNVGFKQSIPKADPVCGGSRIKINGEYYTFGAIGFDFYYSGELAKDFPFWGKRFITKRNQGLTQEEIQMLQEGVSNCKRPSRWGEPAPAAPADDDPWAALEEEETNIPYETSVPTPILMEPPSPTPAPRESQQPAAKPKNTTSTSAAHANRPNTTTSQKKESSNTPLFLDPTTPTGFAAPTANPSIE